MKQISTLSLVAAFILYGSKTLTAQYVARHNMSSAIYQNEFNKWVGQGYRLADISGYSMGGNETYAAIWNKQPGPAWTAKHGLSEQGYQDQVTDLSKQGYRPERISAFNVGGQVRFACIFFKTTATWVAHHDLTAAQYQAEFTKWTGQDYRLIEVCGYNKGGVEKYAAVWEKSRGASWIARHSMSGSDYQSEYNKQAAAGYAPSRVSGFEINGDDRYAAIWEKTGTGIYARHNMDAQRYQAEADNNWYQGSTLIHVNGYTVGGKPRFAALWKGAGLSSADLNTIDSKVKAYMTNSDIPGLSIAVMKNGRLVYAQGYGLANKSTGEIVSPNSLFRIASVSKPITATAIMKLVDQKLLKPDLSDKVFGPSGILGNPCATIGACIDKEDLEKITVQHCLEHSTGWTNDAVWDHYEMNNAEITAWAIKNYTQGTTPGAKYNYNNFNYFLLGRIIEKKSGQTYQNFVKSAVLSKSGITRMRIGADTEAGNAPNEVTYYEGNPYGLKLTRMDANGGWIARPIDLLLFMSSVDQESGKPDVLGSTALNTMFTVSTAQGAGDYAKGWKVDNNRTVHNGCMPGTLATLVRFSNGVSVAIAINTRPSNDQCTWNGMYPLAQAIGQSSIAWPAYDLF